MKVSPLPYKDSESTICLSIKPIPDFDTLSINFYTDSEKLEIFGAKKKLLETLYNSRDEF